jgi:P27 family predicted phage terminase small subunit
MSGPPPTPFHLPILRGNPSRRPLRPEPQPEVEAKVPEPPPFLIGYARAEWEYVAPHLHRLNLLTTLDITMFAAYCVAYSRWRQATEALASEPMTVPTTEGNMRVNPLIRIARDAGADMLRLAGEFGLTPVARSRLAGGIRRRRMKPTSQVMAAASFRFLATQAYPSRRGRWRRD